MTAEMFLELWQSASNHIQKKDRMDAADHFIKIFDSYENLDDQRIMVRQLLDYWLLNIPRR